MIQAPTIRKPVLAFCLMGRIAVLYVVCTSQLWSACNCLVSRSVCEELSNSNLAFIGTVEAVQPSVFDRSNPNHLTDLRKDPKILGLLSNRSKAGIKRLKDRYFELLFDLPNSEKVRLQSVQTPEELETEVRFIETQGTRVRFKIRTLLQQKDDYDDDKKSAVKEENKETVEVWNEAGDCGFPFEKGETYIVYATNDEETDRMETNTCHRTIRVSDGGEDLSYLFFVEHGGEKSLRLEGFVTSDLGQLKLDRFHYSGQVKAAVPNVVVELTSGEGERHVETDQTGRFLFDGLAKGDYSVSVFSSFSNHSDLLSGPTRVHVQAGKCNMMTVLVLSKGLGH